VFCPPGAEWHYAFYDPNPSISNEKISYVRDSTLGLDIVKVLLHTRFLADKNPTVQNVLTAIKQKGDTVFMRSNLTQNTWQILYNYAALPGQSWVTNVQAVPSTTITETYTITVDSVNYTNVNSYNLKVMYVKYSYYPFYSIIKIDEKAIITERFGCDNFMFNYHGYSLNADFSYLNLCYNDNSFGLKQFTSKSCDYIAIVDDNALAKDNLNDLNIKLFPNPSSITINVELLNKKTSDYQLKIINSLGQQEKIEEINKQNDVVTINIHQLKKGIYFLHIFDNDKLMCSEKIIKE
jgi:Fe-S-cluster formation regulator IscX/YfhJ